MSILCINIIMLVLGVRERWKNRTYNWPVCVFTPFHNRNFNNHHNYLNLYSHRFYQWSILLHTYFVLDHLAMLFLEVCAEWMWGTKHDWIKLLTGRDAAMWVQLDGRNRTELELANWMTGDQNTQIVLGSPAVEMELQLESRWARQYPGEADFLLASCYCSPLAGWPLTFFLVKLS